MMGSYGFYGGLFNLKQLPSDASQVQGISVAGCVLANNAKDLYLIQRGVLLHHAILLSAPR